MNRGLLWALSLRWEAIRRMGARQISTRLLRRIRARFWDPWLAGSFHPFPDPLPPAQEIETPWHEEALARLRDPGTLDRRARQLAVGDFELLGLPVARLGRPVAWRASPHDQRLWQYELHYGHWALDLAHQALVGGESETRPVLLDLLTDWIEHNPVGRGVAWEPYPICRRIVWWSRLANLWSDEVWQGFWRDRLEPSLRQQTRFLATNLEFDVPNNHLLANYRALAWMGLLFPHWPESDRWAHRGLEGLWREMGRQVLPDGVHEERSVSYHTIVLQDLQETLYLARWRQVAVPPEVEETVGKMLHFLDASRMPGGSWPMFNDSVRGYPLDPGEVLWAASAWLPGAPPSTPGEGSYRAWFTGESSGEEIGSESHSPERFSPESHSPERFSPERFSSESLSPERFSPERFSPESLSSESLHSERLRLETFPDAGYAILRQGGDCTIFFDAGPMGPRSIPGHGHADALSFELYGAGRPLVVDPGTETYAPGPRRDAQRAMSSHNTVTVDGEDPCVFWGGFRVAWPPEAQILEAQDGHVLGEHRGYLRSKSPVLHRRRIQFTEEGDVDLRDRFEAEGTHHYLFVLQFAEGACAEVTRHRARATWPDGTRLTVQWGDAEIQSTVTEGAVAQGWHRLVSAPRLELRWQATGDCERRFRLQVGQESGSPDEA